MSSTVESSKKLRRIFDKTCQNVFWAIKSAKLSRTEMLSTVPGSKCQGASFI